MSWMPLLTSLHNGDHIMSLSDNIKSVNAKVSKLKTQISETETQLLRQAAIAAKNGEDLGAVVSYRLAEHNAEIESLAKRKNENIKEQERALRIFESASQNLKTATVRLNEFKETDLDLNLSQMAQAEVEKEEAKQAVSKGEILQEFRAKLQAYNLNRFFQFCLAVETNRQKVPRIMTLPVRWVMAATKFEENLKNYNFMMAIMEKAASYSPSESKQFTDYQDKRIHDYSIEIGYNDALAAQCTAKLNLERITAKVASVSDKAKAVNLFHTSLSLDIIHNWKGVPNSQELLNTLSKLKSALDEEEATLKQLKQRNVEIDNLMRGLKKSYLPSKKRREIDDAIDRTSSGVMEMAAFSALVAGASHIAARAMQDEEDSSRRSSSSSSSSSFGTSSSFSSSSDSSFSSSSSFGGDSSSSFSSTDSF